MFKPMVNFDCPVNWINHVHGLCEKTTVENRKKTDTHTHGENIQTLYHPLPLEALVLIFLLSGWYLLIPKTFLPQVDPKIWKFLTHSCDLFVCLCLWVQVNAACSSRMMGREVTWRADWGSVSGCVVPASPETDPEGSLLVLDLLTLWSLWSTVKALLQSQPELICCMCPDIILIPHLV